NGDGYPDVVFNSSPAVIQLQTVSDDRAPGAAPGDLAALVQSRTLVTQAGNNNRLDAVFGILGTHLTDGNDEPFSAPATLRTHEPCGVEQWSPDSASSQHIQCSVTDVNGDGIVDRVNGTSVWLGTGGLGSGSFFTPGAMLTLPGPVAAQTSNQGTA